jgi:hypothetical protein
MIPHGLVASSARGRRRENLFIRIAMPNGTLRAHRSSGCPGRSGQHGNSGRPYLRQHRAVVPDGIPQQLGPALSPAIFATIATSQTEHLLVAHSALPDALNSGFQRALLAAPVIATPTANKRGEAAQAAPTCCQTSSRHDRERCLVKATTSMAIAFHFHQTGAQPPVVCTNQIGEQP